MFYQSICWLIAGEPRREERNNKKRAEISKDLIWKLEIVIYIEDVDFWLILVANSELHLYFSDITHTNIWTFKKIHLDS